MKTPFILFFFITLYSYCCAYDSYQRAQSPRRNDLEWSGYAYSVDEGNCGGTKLVSEDVQKEADPNTYKKTIYTWNGRGMYAITCVRVLNRMPRDENAAETRITDGGVGSDSVRIEMRSQNSQRTHFRVEIWGKETRSATNMAVMMNTPSSVLYMNGKKYCECR